MVRSKRFVIVFLIVVVMALALTTAVGAAKKVFAGDGSWQQIDPFDGSNQTMWINNMNKSAAVLVFDDGASVCGVDGFDDPIYAAFIVGTGGLNKDGNLDTHVLVWCMAESVTMGPELDSTFIYDPFTDTLNNFDGCWDRIGASECAPPPP